MYKHPYTAYGLRVKAGLDAKGASLTDLAEAVGVGMQHIWKVLHGERPDTALRPKINAYLGWKE